METIMIMLHLIAFVGFLALTPLAYFMWRTTEPIIYALFISLFALLCGFITVMAIYDYMTYIKVG